MEANIRKQKVIRSAIILYFQKGYHGTSIREIANHASVNVSLISYYFKNKQGLFESVVIKYYEAYLKELRQALKDTTGLTTKEKFTKLIETILKFKQCHFHLTCSIQRELSLKSMLVSELTVTYLAKENHLLSNLFFDLLKEHKVEHTDKHFLFMNLKGMLITPYVLHNEWKYHVIGDTANSLFVKNYAQTVYKWLDFILMETKVSYHESIS